MARFYNSNEQRSRSSFVLFSDRYYNLRPIIRNGTKGIHALPAKEPELGKKSFICFTSTKLMTALEFGLRVILIAKDAVFALDEADQLWYIIHRDGVNEPDVTEIAPTT